MKKVLLFSFLLLIGLVASQTLPHLLEGDTQKIYKTMVTILTMITLSFIMIHVGYEFEIDKNQLGQYGKDYLIAATAAALPWIFCALYFIFVMSPPELWWDSMRWKESLLEARFAAPTSAGILFSMLAAAGLSATWVFKKARVLAIFDDVDTVLLMIPLKMMMVGLKWQLGIMVILMFFLIYLAWKYLHLWKIPITWPWVLFYSLVITLFSELVLYSSLKIDSHMPIHLEILLPAFVLGCLLARPQGQNPHRDDKLEEHLQGPESVSEQKASTIISSLFMVLVGLSMPAVISFNYLSTQGYTIAGHVILVTLISNLGKMFPLFCYKKETTFKERLALCIGMWPRGEVGAGVLVVSLSYGIQGDAITVALLSLALNLILTGLFIVFVKKLLNSSPNRVGQSVGPVF